MRVINKTEYNVCAHYICSMINGDDSGLVDSDIDLVNSFMEGLPNGHIDVTSDEAEFTRCEVSGLMANCYEITVIEMGE